MSRLAVSILDKKTGQIVKAQTKTQKLKITDDARDLISDGNRPMEQIYASYSNDMKSLGNRARRELIPQRSPARTPMLLRSTPLR